MTVVKSLSLGLLVTTLISGAQAKQTYALSKNESAVIFSMHYMAKKVSARFLTFTGAMNFTSAKPQDSDLHFSIEMASIDTKDPAMDQKLRGDAYLNASKYPKMTFDSKSFRKVGDGKFTVTGPLTIKGHTENVTLPLTLTRQGATWATGEDVLHFKTNFEIDRTQYGLGRSSSMASDQVAIALDLDFHCRK